MSNFALSGATPTINQFFSAAMKISAGKRKGNQSRHQFQSYIANRAKSSASGDTLSQLPNSYQINLKDGMSVATYKTPQGQYIMSFNGTDGHTESGYNRKFFKAQWNADKISASHGVSRAERDAAAYADSMMKTLENQGVSHKDIFITGYSLGGILSQYAAQKTGLAGISFEGTGIPADASHTKDNNFISVASYGDIVPALSSDVKGFQPVAPAYDQNGGSLPHYGSLAMIGDPKNGRLVHAQALLGNKVLSAVNKNLGPKMEQRLYESSVKPMVKVNVLMHDPRVIAKELGIQVTSSALKKLPPNPIMRRIPVNGQYGELTLPEMAQKINLNH